MRRFLVLLFGLCAVVINANPAWENNLKVRGGVAVEWSKACAPVGDGGMLFVWSDSHDGDRDIYAQRVSLQGNPVWTEPRAVDASPGIQRNPALTQTSDGNYVVAWIDVLSNPPGVIRLQKINANCEHLWPENEITLTAGSAWDKQLRLIPDGLGGLIVTWNRETETSLGTWAQSFGPAGNSRWQEGGIPLTSPDYYLATSVVADGENGIYIAYSSDYDSQSRLYLNRIAPDGTPAWAAPVCLGNGTEMHRNGILCRGGNSVWLAWYFYDGYGSAMLMQRYSAQGLAAWSEPRKLCTSDEWYDLTEGLLWSETDNSLLLTLIRSGDQNALYLLKIGLDGQFLYGGGILADANVTSYYSGNSTFLQSDGAGGCYLAWTRFDEVTWYGDIYAQHFSPAGVELWQPGGVMVCNAPGSQPLAVMHFLQGQVWAAWSGRVNSTGGIWYQILNSGGAQMLEPNGRMLFGGLTYMWTEGGLTLPRSNDLLMLWNDDRLREDQSQVYLQAVNPDGSTDFAPDGIAATAPTGADQFISTAKVLPNDQVVVVWNDRRTGAYDLYAQLLDPQGNRLWGETGLQLCNFGNGWDSNVQIGQWGAEILIGWTHVSYDNQSYQGELRLQKIAGGQPLWGMNGINPVYDPEPADNRLMALAGDYLVYLRRPMATSYLRQLYIFKFNSADGSILPVWGALGKPLALEGGGSYWYQSLKGLKLLPESVMALYTDYSESMGQCLMAQAFDADAHYLLAPTGELLQDDIYNLNSVQVLLGDEDFTLFWVADFGESQRARILRMTYALETVWGPLPAGVDAEQASNVHLAAFANAGLALVWQDPNAYNSVLQDALIHYRYLTPEGELLGDGISSFSTRHPSIYNLQIAPLGNRALVTWTDGSSFYGWKDEPIEHTNIWAQLLTNETSGPVDPGTVPVPAAILSANRPNPFSATTTISFSLKDPAPAELAVFNLRGQRVRVLLTADTPAGEHTVVWDGRDEQGREAAAGVYFYRLRTGGETLVKRMLLIH